MTNKVFSQFTYHAVLFFFFVLSVFPMKVLYRMSDFIGLIACRIIRYRRQVVVQNISRAFPEKKYDEIRFIERCFYQNLADMFVEVIKSFSISPLQQNKKLDVEGFDFVKEQIAHGKNVVACLGHCANWEMLNCLPLKIGVNIYTAYKPLKSSIVDRLMLYVRARFGMHLISSASIAKHILSNKGDASLYLLIADQCPPERNSELMVEFLHQKTAIYSGPEKLAKSTNSAVVFIKLTRKQRGQFVAECLPICESAKDLQAREITKKYTQLLEKNIQQDASCWLWSHKRWKK